MCDSPEGVSILARIERKGKPLREDVQLLKAAAALSASVTFSSRSESCSGHCSSPSRCSVLNKAVILNQMLTILMFLSLSMDVKFWVVLWPSLDLFKLVRTKLSLSRRFCRPCVLETSIGWVCCKFLKLHCRETLTWRDYRPAKSPEKCKQSTRVSQGITKNKFVFSRKHIIIIIEDVCATTHTVQCLTFSKIHHSICRIIPLHCHQPFCIFLDPVFWKSFPHTVGLTNLCDHFQSRSTIHHGNVLWGGQRSWTWPISQS